jgi:Lipocalin-like domain
VPGAFGDDPVALLIYDGRGNFSAQFMKRDRLQDEPELVVSSSAPNNSRPVGGYDAYFGRYVIDDELDTVTQTLVGSLSPENVGQVVTRVMSVTDDELTIRVDTAADDGEPAVITLRWRRAG